MDIADLEFLVSDEGRAFNADLSRRPGDSHAQIKWLRRSLSPARAAAVYELHRARRTLQNRHSRAGDMFLDMEAAAQASSELVARWRSERFAGASCIVDLCCGAGIDALALSRQAATLAVDASALRLGFLVQNALLGEGELQPVCGLVPDCIRGADYIFCDPDRRPEGRRVLDPLKASPSLDELLKIPVRRGMGVKLAPGAPLEALKGMGELEFISVQRELKEIVLWRGDLDRGGPRVSLPALRKEWLGRPGLSPGPASNVGAFLLDPDPALIRSGLLGDLAQREGLLGLSPGLAWLTADEPLDHPLFSCRRVLAYSRAAPRHVQKMLAQHDIGILDISRRGFPQSPEEFRRQLRLKGSSRGHLYLTRLGEQRIAVLTDAECYPGGCI